MAEIPRGVRLFLGAAAIGSLGSLTTFLVFGDPHLFASAASETIHVDLETPEVVADPEVIKLDDAYGNYQSVVNIEEDKIWTEAIKRGNVDLFCLDSILDKVDVLQKELHNEYVHFLEQYNSGNLSQADIDAFNARATEKRAQIQIALQQAWDKTHGSNAYSCA